MNNKELKKLTREQLLEVLLAQSREIDRLRDELEKTRENLSRKEEKISGAESVAEASIALNSFLETAQAAADQYLWNIRRLCEEKASAAGKAAEWNAALAEIENAEKPEGFETAEKPEMEGPENDGEGTEKAEPVQASGSGENTEL